MKIVVNDTNILIDLADIDLLNELTKLNFELHTNDFIIAEILNPEHIAKVQRIIDNKRLFVATTKFEEYEEIRKLQCLNLSFEDCSVWYYAKKINGILLTGDGNLRKTAKNAGIDLSWFFISFPNKL